ncbi:MAG TPA: nuclear transport factor 2 family protein [Acidimicrobiia bacterium]|nr:nuclear transport factor 2 family protein [Acidimicrobiia bacterium]
MVSSARNPVEAVEIVGRFTAALAAGDVKTCLALLHPDNVFDEAPGLPFGGDYSGHEGFIRLLKDVGRLFEVKLSEPQVSPAGDCVLVRLTGTFTSRATGRTLETPVVDLYTVRDGKVARVDVFYKDTRAMAQLCAEDGR